MYKIEDYLTFEEDPTIQMAEGQGHYIKYMEDVHQSIQRQYNQANIEDVNARRGCLRMSSLGKPAVLQLLEYQHIKEELATVYPITEFVADERKSLMFHLGDIFEAWYEFLLQRHGLEVISPPLYMGRQWEFHFNGVKGHADLIVKVPGTVNTYWMIDCKASGSYAVRSLQKDPWLSKPEYVTQVSLYAHCFKEWMDAGCEEVEDYKPATVIPVIASLNCDERRVYYTYIDAELQQQSITRAEKLIEVLPTITSLSDMRGKIKAPPAVEVLYRNKPVGDVLTVPPCMKFCDCLDLFYDIEEVTLKLGRYNKKVQSIGHIEGDGTFVTHYLDPARLLT